ncbi:hypothetical protein HC891_00585 [Candidatus Gracilibacteria bacterium]|nr:hypothetical protein [Candidatus Gracilibacteria bacterium]
MRLVKLGFISYVDDLVVASDIVITKPGGLITSEVLARGTPIIAIDPIPGQEEWNSDVICGTGAGLQIRMPELVPPAVHMLLENPQRLAEMRNYAQQVGHPRAAFAIADIVLADLAKHPKSGSEAGIEVVPGHMAKPYTLSPFSTNSHAK